LFPPPSLQPVYRKEKQKLAKELIIIILLRFLPFPNQMVNSFTTASSKDIFCLFLGGLGCVGHSFASVAYYVFLEMWI
jgi:hypothetical protein